MDMPFYLGVLFLTISLIAFTMSLGGIIYQHLVEFPNWSAHMPESLDAYKSFFKTKDFGDFFKIFMPASGAGLLIAVFLLWNKPAEANKYNLLAMAGIILTAAFTNIYFIPKHEKLFSKETDTISTSELNKTARQWKTGNYFRIMIMALTGLAMMKAYQLVV